ncbi:DUF1376 domain-containing protein [Bartonella vinsonii]|uniref:Uncharacterized protein conserved in bacteria n=1 Tax=Bartonella vinsonii TaxID=33047 RepID=A0A3S4YUZ8_BARVI|nr:DUF1376 domain-containing protein [Bartonella vinsonii]VEJ45244.1 Uncharacterized protein conserved in bacteria [Bartonella vinsonii]
MSTKLPWTRLFADKWLLDLACLPAIEGNVYMRLRLQMLRTREPLVNDAQILSHFTCCSVKRFQKALDYLFRSGHIVLSEDGHLWCPDVEEELKNSDETLNKFAERAAKAANTRKHKNQEDSLRKPQDSLRSLEDSSRGLQDSSRGYNNNNINIYNKKTNTIVLAKKEIASENLETNDLVDEPTEVRDCESQPEQIATVSENQPPIHEQENVSQKAKRAKANRGCRLPDDFEPDYDFAIAEGLPPERVKVEMAKFRDYWKAKTGKDATKIDWQATWRNWVRNSKDHKVNKQGGNYGKFTPKTFTEQLAEGFSELRNHLASRQDYRDDQSGVSIDAEDWEYIDETGGGTDLRCLQSSGNLAFCESFS